MWKKKKGIEATYRNLLKLFVEAGHAPCANRLCELLEEKSILQEEPGKYYYSYSYYHTVSHALLGSCHILKCDVMLGTGLILHR